jgi:hypothetical protein
MSVTRARFSILVNFYVLLFFSIASFLPAWAVFATSLGNRFPLPCRLAAVSWPAAVAGLYRYASNRCSDERLRYQDGLRWVAASLTTGWLYMSAVLVLPVLLVVFVESVMIALYGDIRRMATFAAGQNMRPANG